MHYNTLRIQRRLIRLLCCCAIFSLALRTADASAISVAASPAASPTNVSGSASTPGAVVAGGNWIGEFRVDWDVTLNQDGTWHYQYTFFNAQGEELGPAVSHFILQLSDDLTSEGVFNFSGDIDMNDPEGIEFDTFGAGSSNPGFPESTTMYGVKVNMGGDQLTFEFDSVRRPMWGDFYAKGGNTSYAYNASFGIDAVNADDYLSTPVDENDSPLSKILVPNSSSEPIPEPSTAVLLAIGAVMLVSRGRRLLAARRSAL
jgi:hypothetical protein